MRAAANLQGRLIIVVKFAAIATAVIAVVYLVMPQEKFDHGRESWMLLTRDSGQASLAYERLQLIHVLGKG